VIVAGTLTGVLAVAATVTGLMALHHQSVFEERRPDAYNPDLPPCRAGDVRACVDLQNQAWADAHNAANRANGFALATDILIAAAVAGAITTGVLWITRSKRRSRDVAATPGAADFALAPRLAPREAGLTVATTF
jgi:hypothetical protein